MNMGMKRNRILVSACLLGVNCRYAGNGQALKEISELMEIAELIPVCPEILGGLPTPRPPAECSAGRVICQDGADVSEAFMRGAQETLRLARLFGAERALLKERSPSCGYGQIYDGKFEKRLVAGNGVTAGLLSENGIHIYGETQIKSLMEELRRTEEK